MRIAVTGAAGAVGSRVVGLLAAGARSVVAIVRAAGRVQPTPGVVEVVADYTDRHALTTALAGVDGLVFIGSDGEADRMLVHHRNVLDAAASAGVRRIVLLGCQDADPASPFCYAHTYATTEQWLSGSCAEPVVVRAGLYAEFFGRWLVAAADGVLALPMGDGAVAPVAKADVAASLVAAVTAPWAGSVGHVITGPESFDHAGLAEVAGHLMGRPVTARPVSLDEFAHRLVRTEQSPWWRYAFTTMFAAIQGGAFADVTDTVHQLTGSEPIPFLDALQGR